MPGQGAETRAAFQRKNYQPQVTTQELGVKVGQSFNTLIEAIKTGNTERLTSYLAFSSRFHRYSRRNQQLIFEQCPEATRVANYVRWKEEGYQVRWMDKKKGEKGISILVPKFPKGLLTVAKFIYLLYTILIFFDPLTFSRLFERNRPKKEERMLSSPRLNQCLSVIERKE